MTSPSTISDFFERKKSWLQKHLQNYEKLRQKIPAANLKHGEMFPFKGRELRLNCVLTLNTTPFFSVHEDQLLLHVPKNFWTEKSRQQIYPWSDLLYNFYEKQGRAWIDQRVVHWSQIMQLFPKKVKYRAPKTRWGSCSSQGILNFNWKLIVYSPDVIDYVIIHELAHLAHLNHSKAFWGIVQKYCPDRKLREAELKEKHFQSYFLKS